MYFLFDLDGTIVFTDELYQQVWARILNGVDYNKNIQGKADVDVYTSYFKDIDMTLDDLSKTKDDLFIELLNKTSIQTIPGCKKFLEFLSLKKIKMVIVTNCNRPSAIAILEKLNILHLFEGVITCNDVENPKPCPDPYTAAITLLGVSEKDCVVFEDTSSGIQSGIAAGVDCIIGIESTFDKRTLKQFGCDLTITDYTELDCLYNRICLLKNK